MVFPRKDMTWGFLFGLGMKTGLNSIQQWTSIHSFHSEWSLISCSITVWTWHYSLNQSWSCNCALTSLVNVLVRVFQLSLAWPYFMFLLKSMHIWVHNRLRITPGAHSSLLALIYVLLICACGLVRTVDVAVVADLDTRKWYNKALWGVSRCPRDGARLCLYIYS